MKLHSFKSGRDAPTSVFKRNGFDGAGINVGHTADDFFVPSCYNRFILCVFQTLDERTSKVGAFRYG